MSTKHNNMTQDQFLNYMQRNHKANNPLRSTVITKNESFFIKQLIKEKKIKRVRAAGEGSMWVYYAINLNTD